MNKKRLTYFTAAFLVSMYSCETPAPQQEVTQNTVQPAQPITQSPKNPKVEEPYAGILIDDTLKPFMPEGFIINDKLYGDLNKDGLDDWILVIKGTDTANIVIDRNDEKADRNRQGIIILFKQSEGYTLASKNYDCFSSDNEDGGAYFAPELLIEAKNGNLLIEYMHGRYGNWGYTFRYNQSDFELIGYDQSVNDGPVTNRKTSINFLSKKKLVRVNVNKDAEGDDEVFEDKWETINIKHLLKLSEITDFDALDMNELK